MLLSHALHLLFAAWDSCWTHEVWNQRTLWVLLAFHAHILKGWSMQAKVSLPSWVHHESHDYDLYFLEFYGWLIDRKEWTTNLNVFTSPPLFASPCAADTPAQRDRFLHPSQPQHCSSLHPSSHPSPEFDHMIEVLISKGQWLKREMPKSNPWLPKRLNSIHGDAAKMLILSHSSTWEILGLKTRSSGL